MSSSAETLRHPCVLCTEKDRWQIWTLCREGICSSKMHLGDPVAVLTKADDEFVSRFFLPRLPWTVILLCMANKL